MDKINIANILLLAGGRSSRMGGIDKALIKYNDKPMIESLIANMPENCDKLIISCNRNQDKYIRYSSYLIDDHQYSEIEAYSGPLLGILTALDQYPENALMVLPCDTPKLSKALISSLMDKHFSSNHTITCLTVDDKIQPLHAVIDASVRDSLFTYLASGKRRAQEWVLAQEPQLLDATAQAEQLLNMNWPSDLF